MNFNFWHMIGTPRGNRGIRLAVTWVVPISRLLRSYLRLVLGGARADPAPPRPGSSRAADGRDNPSPRPRDTPAARQKPIIISLVCTHAWPEAALYVGVSVARITDELAALGGSRLGRYIIINMSHIFEIIPLEKVIRCQRLISVASSLSYSDHRG